MFYIATQLSQETLKGYRVPVYGFRITVDRMRFTTIAHLLTAAAYCDGGDQHLGDFNADVSQAQKCIKLIHFCA